jgi:hypothetical protein
LLLDFQEQVGEACAEESNEEEAQFVNFATCGCVPNFGAGAGAAAVGEPLGAEADEEPGSELEAVSMDEGEPLLLEVESLPAGEILGGREHQLVLASKVCTFASTGSNFTEQHWYYCNSCGLTQSEGCCSICVSACHEGHVVSYSHRSRFFCDCGAGTVAARGITCIALTPRALPPQPERQPHACHGGFRTPAHSWRKCRTCSARRSSMPRTSSSGT